MQTSFQPHGLPIVRIEKDLKMTISTYEAQFETILSGKYKLQPYDEEAFFNYTQLNERRLKRWYKTGKLLPELEQHILSLEEAQNWLLITEPWCGDAAHVQPFIAKLAQLNPNIQLSVQNRDAPGSEIDQYLTNGGRSIPKLIVRDAKGQDLFNWGPRPKPAQAIHLSHINNDTLSKEEKKIALQNWYNQDKGLTFQQELLDLLLNKN